MLRLFCEYLNCEMCWYSIPSFDKIVSLSKRHSSAKLIPPWATLWVCCVSRSWEQRQRHLWSGLIKSCSLSSSSLRPLACNQAAGTGFYWHLIAEIISIQRQPHTQKNPLTRAHTHTHTNTKTQTHSETQSYGLDEASSPGGLCLLVGFFIPGATSFFNCYGMFVPPFQF